MEGVVLLRLSAPPTDPRCSPTNVSEGDNSHVEQGNSPHHPAACLSGAADGVYRLSH